MRYHLVFLFAWLETNFIHQLTNEKVSFGNVMQIYPFVYLCAVRIDSMTYDGDSCYETPVCTTMCS